MSCIDYYYFLQKVLQLHKGLLEIYIGVNRLRNTFIKGFNRLKVLKVTTRYKIQLNILFFGSFKNIRPLYIT